MKDIYHKLRQISTGLFCTSGTGGWGAAGKTFKSLSAVSRAAGQILLHNENQARWIKRGIAEGYPNMTPKIIQKVEEEIKANAASNMEIISYKLVIGNSWLVGTKPPKERI